MQSLSLVKFVMKIFFLKIIKLFCNPFCSDNNIYDIWGMFQTSNSYWTLYIIVLWVGKNVFLELMLGLELQNRREKEWKRSRRRQKLEYNKASRCQIRTSPKLKGFRTWLKGIKNLDKGMGINPLKIVKFSIQYCI